MTGLRRFLAKEIQLRLSWGELLAIILLVVVINAVFPGTPTWVFFIVGTGAGMSKNAIRWLSQRWVKRTAP